MTDLNVMMREHARSGLQTQLDAAVTNGDTAEARKITDQIAALAVQTAPKAPPYGDVEIRAQLEKAPWFGIDPKKSAKAVEFGKTMDPKKFATAEAFAAALIKSVDDEFKPAGAAAPAAGGEDGGGEDDGNGGEGDDDTKPAASEKPRRTDGPGENDTNTRTARRTTGPWVKITDAPADIQKEIKRQTEKFVASSAPAAQRDKYVAKALESHYAAHVRAKGKK